MFLKSRFKKNFVLKKKTQLSLCQKIRSSQKQPKRFKHNLWRLNLSKRWFRFIFYFPTLNKSTTFLTILNQHRKCDQFWRDIWVSNVNVIISKFLTKYYQSFFVKISLFQFSPIFTKRIFFEQLYNFCTFYKTTTFFNNLKFGRFLYFKKYQNTILFDPKLYFTFSSRRLFFNLRDYQNKNYFSLAVGIFLKYFNYQKSLKKTKSFKFLLAKFLRKILIVSGIRNMTLFLKRPPVLLAELFRFLTRPIISPFFDPINNKVVIEDDDNYTTFNFKYFFFIRSVSFTSMKRKQKGRLKRKVSKKIIKRNRITDEA